MFTARWRKFSTKYSKNFISLSHIKVTTVTFFMFKNLGITLNYLGDAFSALSITHDYRMGAGGEVKQFSKFAMLNFNLSILFMLLDVKDGNMNSLFKTCCDRGKFKNIQKPFRTCLLVHACLELKQTFLLNASKALQQVTR